MYLQTTYCNPAQTFVFNQYGQAGSSCYLRSSRILSGPMLACLFIWLLLKVRAATFMLSWQGISAFKKWRCLLDRAWTLVFTAASITWTSKVYTNLVFSLLVFRCMLLCGLKWHWLVMYSLCPKKNVILGILGQVIKKVKWPQLPLFICHIRC
jgi:hypothetical protein